MKVLRKLVNRPTYSRKLIDLPSLTEIKNPTDGRIISKLEKPITIELMDKMELGGDSFVYRFAIPGRDSCLGHQTCQYLEFEADVENGTKQMTRYYHPMSKVNDSGILDLLIKVYLRNFKFPQGGAFT